MVGKNNAPQGVEELFEFLEREGYKFNGEEIEKIKTAYQKYKEITIVFHENGVVVKQGYFKTSNGIYINKNLVIFQTPDGNITAGE